MVRGLVLLLLLPLGLTACGDPSTDTASGNVAGTSLATQPTDPQWYAGQLVVEPGGRGGSCLTLVTRTDTYVLRPATSTLTPVVWKENGSFDATRSGIARGDRLVAPYADQRTSVRGGVVVATDPECPSHPTLAFTKVRRGDAPAAVPPVPSPTTSPVATGAPAGAIAAGPAKVWKTGRLTIVPGNQGDDPCLALETAAGAYALGSASDRFDAVVSLVQGVVDRRTTGIHIHGRNALGMARTYGQRVELLGTVSPNTDFSCSDYLTFAFVELR